MEGAVHVVRDVTRRKLSEKEEQRLQSMLIQAQKMEAIGTLAGGVAHDFNNILAAMIGYTELGMKFTEENPLVRQKLYEVLKRETVPKNSCSKSSTSAARVSKISPPQNHSPDR